MVLSSTTNFGLHPSLWISLKIALGATLIVFIVGLPVAWALSRPQWPGKTVVDVAVNLPLALPPTVLGYYLLLLISPAGPIGALAKKLWGASLVLTPGAAVLAAAIVSMPLFVQSARNALEAVRPDVWEAAQLDGAGSWQGLRYIFLPLAWPGIWTGLILAYVRSLGEFGATLMVAGNIPGQTQTLSLAVYSAVQAGNQTVAHRLALLLTSVAAISIWAALRWRGRSV